VRLGACWTAGCQFQGRRAISSRRSKSRRLGQEGWCKASSRRQQIIKIIYDELVKLLGSTHSGLALSGNPSCVHSWPACTVRAKRPPAQSWPAGCKAGAPDVAVAADVYRRPRWSNWKFGAGQIGGPGFCAQGGNGCLEDRPPGAGVRAAPVLQPALITCTAPAVVGDERGWPGSGCANSSAWRAIFKTSVFPLERKKPGTFGFAGPNTSSCSIRGRRYTSRRHQQRLARPAFCSQRGQLCAGGSFCPEPCRPARMTPARIALNASRNGVEAEHFTAQSYIILMICCPGLDALHHSCPSALILTSLDEIGARP